jgi:hypothetical protein
MNKRQRAEGAKILAALYAGIEKHKTIGPPPIPSSKDVDLLITRSMQILMRNDFNIYRTLIFMTNHANLNLVSTQIYDQIINGLNRASEEWRARSSLLHVSKTSREIVNDLARFYK